MNNLITISGTLHILNFSYVDFGESLLFLELWKLASLRYGAVTNDKHSQVEIIYKLSLHSWGSDVHKTETMKCTYDVILEEISSFL